MAHLPYLILGFVVFVLFLIAARIAKGILNTAGRRTRLDRTLADLLGRLTSAFNNRRVRLNVGIGYQDSIERARSVIRDVLQKTEGVLPEPAPSVLVAELAPSSVNLNVFFWTNSRQRSVLTVTDNVMTGIKLALDEAGIEIPYPHTVVLHQSPATSADGTSPQHR